MDTTTEPLANRSLSVSLVSSAAKKIIVLANGRVVSDSSPETLSDDAVEFLRETEAADIAASHAVPGELVERPIETIVREAKPKNSGKLVTEETQNKGRVPKTLAFEYLKYFGPLIITVFLVLISVFDNAVE